MMTPAHDKLTEPVAAEDTHWIDPSTEGYVCPECQAEMGMEAMYCPQCELITPMSLFKRPPHRSSSDSTFSLSSLILLMTLICFVLAVFSWAPGLGILLTLVVVPAGIRTLMINRRVIQAGKPLNRRMKIETFVVSLVVSTAAWGACGFTSSFVGGVLLIVLSQSAGAAMIDSPAILLLSIIPALIAGLLSFFYMFHILRDYSSIRY